MDSVITKPESPMPSFMRGIRQLYGIDSLRELAKVSNIHASALSRVERGLNSPSIEMLWKWAAGVTGRPNPDLWVLGIYAAAATWPGVLPFLFVRYTDVAHDPELCWSLAERAAWVQKTVVPSESQAICEYEQRGKLWYPHFDVAYREFNDAVKAAWFTVFCRSDPPILSKVLQSLPQEDSLSLMQPEALNALWIWLVEVVWATDGHVLPIAEWASRQSLRDNPSDQTDNNAETVTTDPETHYLEQRWPLLTPQQRHIILSLIKSWDPDQP